MPIFEYECRQCGHRFEKIVFANPGRVDCPQCQGSHTEKVFSTFAVSAGGRQETAPSEPCPCGAPRRGMCQN